MLILSLRGAADGATEKLMERAPDGTTRAVWACNDFTGELGANEYCQSNSMWWDATTDTVLYSFYSLDTIIEVDRASGATLRWWGNAEDAWAFDPPESQFWWQHGPMWTEGDLLVSSMRHLGGGGAETVVYEYALDESTQTLTEVWSAGVGEGIYAETDGEARRLANGNTLHNMGDAGRLREWTPAGDLVWDVDFGSGRLLGHTTFVPDLYAFAP